MTNVSLDRPALTGAVLSPGSFEVRVMGLANGETNSFDVISERNQALNYRGPLGRCSFTEAYLKGRLQICFKLAHPKGFKEYPPLFACAGLIVDDFKPSPIGHRNGPVGPEGAIRLRQHGNELDELGDRHFGDASGRKDELVLVGDVQQMDGLYSCVPAKIWFEFFDRAKDIFTSVSQLSLSNGMIEFFSLPSKRKLDRLMRWGLVPDYCEYNQVQRTPKVVNGIASDEAYGIWNGDLAFNEAGRLQGVKLVANHEFHRLSREIRLDFPLKVENVMLRPSNFKNGWL